MACICGRSEAAQGMFRAAVEHVQSTVLDPGSVLNDGCRDDLCRSLLRYAGHSRRRNDAEAMQQVMDITQKVLQSRAVPKQDLLRDLHLICRHVISGQVVGGATVGVSAALLCSGWQLMLLVMCLAFAGLFVLLGFDRTAGR